MNFNEFLVERTCKKAKQKKGKVTCAEVKSECDCDSEESKSHILYQVPENPADLYKYFLYVMTANGR